MHALRQVDPKQVARLAVGLGVAFFFVGLWLALRHVVGLVPWEPNLTVDFDYYATAGQMLARGEDPYAAYIHLRETLESGGYPYPPLLAWALVPLVTTLPARWHYLVWVIAEVAVFAASLTMVLRAGRAPVAWHWVVLIVGAAFLPYFTWYNLYHGQVDFILLLLIAGGVCLLAKDRPIAAGILFALAANVKPFLAILLLYLAWRSRWRAFFAMGFAGAAILIGSFLPTIPQHGLAVVEGWIGASRAMGQPPFTGFPFNNSVYGTLVRLVTPTPFAVPWVESQTLLIVLTALFGLIVPVVWLRAIPPGRLRPDTDVVTVGLVETGMLLTLMFAWGPIAEANHLIVLWPVMLVTLRLALASPDPAQRLRWRPAALGWGLFLLLTAGPIRQLTWTEPLEGVPEGIAVLFTGRVGVLLLIAGLTTAWSLAQEHRVSRPYLSLRTTLGRWREPRAA